MQPPATLQQLTAMSRLLGDPAQDCVILGEGNTSARADESTYWIKASGTQLHQIMPADFVHLQLNPVLELLARKDISDEQVKQTLQEAMIPSMGHSEPDGGKNQARPSIEATMHAVFYESDEVNFIGHTHPTVVNAILCAQDYQEVLRGRLFPDQIVFCGVEPMFVPYAEPGLALARQVKQDLRDYLDRYAAFPKVIYLQNHGLVALGKTASEVEKITLMTIKSCRILLGTYNFGGPHFLRDTEVARITTRPDELYRRKLAGM